MIVPPTPLRRQVPSLSHLRGNFRRFLKPVGSDLVPLQQLFLVAIDGGRVSLPQHRDLVLCFLHLQRSTPKKGISLTRTMQLGTKHFS